MNNCSDCTYKCIKFSELTPIEKDMVLISKSSSVTGDMYGKCLNNNTSKLVSFFKEYGDKPRKELESVSMECFEETYGVKILTEAIKCADLLLEELNKK